MYQERNIKYRITSNRLRILTRGHKEFPNMRIYKKAISWNERPQQDYIENKIRVMQQHRLKFVIPGKNPEYYFLEASKQALRNEIPQAVESLNKGLMINPTNLYCRFNRGVLMYMLGLLEDAQLDFELVTSIYPKEQLGHFNLALTCFQLGEYQKAICSLEPLFSDATAALIELQRIYHSHKVAHLGQSGKCHTDPNKEKHYDFELLEDAFMLKAKSHFRLPEQIINQKKPQEDNIEMKTDVFKESLKKTTTTDSHQQTLTSLNYSKKFKIWKKIKSRHMKHKYSRKELELELVDQYYKEFKMDIKDSYEMYVSTLSRSQPK